MKLSKKKQQELIGCKTVVEKLYQDAINRWGEEKVRKDLTKLWDLRCMYGISRQLPFGSTAFKNLGEMLYVAREVCGYGKEKQHAHETR